MGGRSAGDVSLGLAAAKGFIGKLTQAILGFAGTIVFARILGPTKFGGFYFLLSLVYVADRPLRGFGKAVQKRYSETNANEQELIGAILLSVTAFSAISAVVVLFAGDLLRAETNVDGAAFVFLALLISVGLFTTLENVLGAAGLPSVQIWTDTLRSIFTLGLQLVFVLSGLGAAGMGYGLASATFLVVPLILYYARQRPSIPSRETLRSLWTYARYSIPSSYVSVAYNRLDTLMLGFFLTTGAVGQYEVARKLTIPGTLLASALGVAFMPKISNLASREEDVTTDIRNALSFNSILSIPIFFGALAISTQLVFTVYGPEYRQASTLLVGLAAYQVIFTQKQIMGGTISGLDRPDLQLKINIGSFLFNVVVGIALLFTYGPLGVVLATVVSELISYTATMFVVREFIPNLNPFTRPLFEQILAGLFMFLVVESVVGVFSIHNWFDLLVVVGVGTAVYGFTLLVISPNLRTTIWSVYVEARA